MLDSKLPFNLAALCELLSNNIIGKMVRNKVIFSNEDFIIMVVIGPNNRSDYHVNSKQVKYYISYLINYNN